jgi:hypothetical protein
MCLQYIPIKSNHSIILFYPPLPLTTISTGFIVLFSYMNTKYIHNIFPPSPSAYDYLTPTGTCPLYLLVDHFNAYIDSLRGFTLVFQTCKYCALNQINPPPLLFNGLEYIAL